MPWRNTTMFRGEPDCSTPPRGSCGRGGMGWHAARYPARHPHRVAVFSTAKSGVGACQLASPLRGRRGIHLGGGGRGAYCRPCRAPESDRDCVSATAGSRRRRQQQSAWRRRRWRRAGLRPVPALDRVDHASSKAAVDDIRWATPAPVGDHCESMWAIWSWVPSPSKSTRVE